MQNTQFLLPKPKAQVSRKARGHTENVLDQKVLCKLSTKVIKNWHMKNIKEWQMKLPLNVNKKSEQAQR